MKNLLLAILFHLLIVANSFAASKPLLPSGRLTINDGLVHNGVTSILEDFKGYLWIGTYDGLNRYDGYGFISYRNQIGEEIISSNRVRTLVEDVDGNIWIGTDYGIDVYDRSKQRIRSVYKSEGDSPCSVVKILCDPEEGHILCVTAHSTAVLLDKEGNVLDRYLFEEEFVTFTSAVQLSKNLYLLTSMEGVYFLDLNKKTIEHVLKGTIKGVYEATKATGQYLLLATQSGLLVLSYEDYGGELIFNKHDEIHKGHPFSCVSIDHHGDVWLGHLRKGILRLSNLYAILNGGTVVETGEMLDDDVIRSSCITPTQNFGCWYGTYNKGIYNFLHDDIPFRYSRIEEESRYSLKKGEGAALAPYNDSLVFVSIFGERLGCFNTRKQRYVPFPNMMLNLLNKGVSFVVIDSVGNTWLRVHNDIQKICRVPKGRSTLERIEVGNPKFESMGVSAFAVGAKGYLWFGGNQGLYRLKLNDDNSIGGVESVFDHPFFDENKDVRVRALYSDLDHGYLWVGTKEDGLYRITVAEKPIKSLEIKAYIDDAGKSIFPSSYVSAIIRLPNDDLWLGFERGGIGELIETQDTAMFIGYSEKHGLSNNVVKSFQYDGDHNLWITTNIGLNRLNTKDNTFRQFRMADGLPFEDYSYPSCKMADGMLLFSGLEGFCFFDPQKVPASSPIPYFEISSLKILNDLILPNDTVKGRVVLEQPIGETEKIELRHNQNAFALEVTSLHYSVPSSFRLRYQLLPHNKEWVEVASDNKNIQFNGLLDGNYTFRVKASNAAGQWSESVELAIEVRPPFWRAGWFHPLLFLLVGLGIFARVYSSMKISNLRQNLKIEGLEKEREREVNDAKLQFFSNIAHEIKTPVTLIAGPVNILLERFKHLPEVTEKLHILRRQSRKISELVDQVHDFQRADANELKMNTTVFNFGAFIEDIKEDFAFLASNEEKQLLIDAPQDSVYINADEDKLFKIFTNLLSNAFKFTSPGDEIKIEYRLKEEGELAVKVSDQGKGIDADDLPHIFERFFQSEKMKAEYTGGSGIGLAFTKRLVEMHYGYITAESAVGEGTTIIMNLPVVVEAPQASEDLEENILSSERDFAGSSLTTDVSKVSSIQVSDLVADATIFLVEDNTDMRLFVEELLSNFFSVQAFANGKLCLEAMENEWPDLVLSDVLMPDMNGFELTRAIKSDIKLSHIPVVLLTACTVMDDQVQGIKEGADAYILKPFDVEHLITSVEQLLIGRNRLRERFEASLPLQLKKEDEGGKDVVFLEKLYKLMNDNIANQELDLNQFARELYLNRTHFFQKVKALTNQTPFELLKNYRLKKAAELLLNEKLPVNEVIDATGFKSRSHFIKSFKEKYNTTPGKYAQELNGDVNA